MKFRSAIDWYIAEMRDMGRLNSKRSEVTYRSCLERHAEDIGNRDPRTVGREDVKRTLRRFDHPNTTRRHRSMLVSFYDFLMEEGIRKDNPARQTRAPKARKPEVYRLTFEEVQRYLRAATGTRERRIAFLGVCAGLRREELRLLQGRHLGRKGWVWVSSDIAKGAHERWVPVIADLTEVVEEIRANVPEDQYVLPRQQFSDPPFNKTPRDYPADPPDGKTIWRTTQRIGKRAGISVPVNPHMMRHAFADHLARYGGVRLAQLLLGHADIGTTQGYLGMPTLDDLRDAVGDVTFALEATPPEEVAETQQWRRSESNRRELPIDPQSLSGVLAALFASPILRDAARSMA